MAIAAGIVCCALLAVSHGADQVDSGWSIGVPSPFATAPKSYDAHQQYILRSVLDQTQHPLLQNPRPTAVAPPESEDGSRSQERIATRPEGWHKTGETVEVSTENAAPADNLPPTESQPVGVANNSHDDELECDCSGHEAQHAAPKPAQNQIPPPWPMHMKTCRSKMAQPPAR